MLGKKLAFYTAYNHQKNGLAERMSHTMEDIIRRLCAYVLEYKDHEGYTNDWVTLLPAVHFHEMWKKACDTAAKCIAEAK
ncbi:hypothetical protein O181_097885 [Austropuccinia psidii MF-1]|uniref:Uncharacterized protein n=1 Tax=Austropuccinia psidii MF-1 TaxID=1389203 RepID=A0A9Q3PED3_9BASI|nr:hypothetical protein [Austropuccinia psidii MF-1]